MSKLLIFIALFINNMLFPMSIALLLNPSETDPLIAPALELMELKSAKDVQLVTIPTKKKLDKKNKVHRCTVQGCNKFFSTSYNRKQHAEFAHNICKICDQQLDNLQILQKHNLDRHNRIVEYELLCTLCKYKAKSEQRGGGGLARKRLNRHISVFHKEKHAEEEHIEEEYVEKEYSSKKFKCGQEGCDKKFHSKDYLASHQECKHNICRKCLLQCDTIQSLQEHNKEKHERTLTYFLQCDFCDFNHEGVRQSLTKFILAEHIKMQHPKKQKLASKDDVTSDV